MSDKLVKGQIGLEDLLLGEGQVQQDFGNGYTRTVTKINAGNLPFDDAKTFAETLADFKELVQSSDFNDIAAIKSAIANVSTNLQLLSNISSKLPVLDRIIAMDAAITGVSTSIEDIKKANDSALVVHRDTKRVEALMCKLQQMHTSSIRYANYIDKAYATEFKPLKEHLDNTIAIAENLVANAAASIQAGHNMANKFGTYSIEVLCVAFCQTPKFIVDDANSKLLFILPRITSYNVLPEPTASYVQAAVDLYLANADLNAQGGTNTEEVQALIDTSINNLIGGATEQGDTLKKLEDILVYKLGGTYPLATLEQLGD